MLLALKYFTFSSACIVISHVWTSTFFTKANTKPNKISDIILCSGPGNQILFMQPVTVLVYGKLEICCPVDSRCE